MEIPIGHQIRLMMKIKEFKKTSKYEALEGLNLKYSYFRSLGWLKFFSYYQEHLD